MPAGDLIVEDDQYEVNAYLMGTATVLVEGDGVSGWSDVNVESNDVKRSLRDGSIGGTDTRAPNEILIPLVIIADTEADARDELALLQDAWLPSSTNVELHRQVAGVHSYVEGRTRGVTVAESMARSGVIPVLCTFRALEPAEVVVSS